MTLSQLTIIDKLELVGAKPIHLATQDRSVAQKPHWGFHCSASLHKRELVGARPIHLATQDRSVA